eukprot:Sspe_Gene.118933::Locus_113554_Transcript_1_1_Confidence_1.000_Length_649::g.118933::m.118933
MRTALLALVWFGLAVEGRLRWLEAQGSYRYSLSDERLTLWDANGTGSTALINLDVQPPSHPQEMRVSGDTAYVLTTTGVLLLNTSSLRTVGMYAVQEAVSIALDSDRTVYVTSTDGSLYTIPPQALFGPLLPSIRTPILAPRVIAVHRGRLFLSGRDTLLVYNVEGPTPVLVGGRSTPELFGFLFAGEVAGEVLYAGGST